VLGAKCSELRIIDFSYVALISDIALRSIVRCCKVFSPPSSIFVSVFACDASEIEAEERMNFGT
jgi:hypothetical protein